MASGSHRSKDERLNRDYLSAIYDGEASTEWRSYSGIQSRTVR
jgi:hypothetical protein